MYGHDYVLSALPADLKVLDVFVMKPLSCIECRRITSLRFVLQVTLG